MFTRLRSPGGTIGNLSVVSAVLLALLGGVGAIAMVVALAADSSFWSDSAGDKAVALAFFVLAIAGALGFVLMDRSPWGGAALAVVGGLALSLVMFWAIVPLVVGVGAAVVAVLRARSMHTLLRATPTGP